MGRRKTYDGVIERVTEPAFSKKYNWWSFSVKHDGKWNSVTSRDKKSAQNQYKIYVRRSKANECGINLVSSPLTEQQFQMAQLAFNRLDTVGHLKIDDDKTAKVLISFRAHLLFGSLMDFKLALSAFSHIPVAPSYGEGKEAGHALFWPPYPSTSPNDLVLVS
jgi:hypothetical protein